MPDGVEVGGAFVGLRLDEGSFEQDLDRAVDAAVASVDATVPVLADADDVTTSIDAAVEAADAQAQVQGDASEVTAAVDAAVADAQATVPVDADTAAAAAEIAGLADDAPTIEVPVEVVGAEAAAAEVASVGDAAGAAAGGVGDLSGGVAGLSAATDLAGGSAAGLGNLLGNLGPKAGAAGAGIAALAGFTHQVFTNALAAEAATHRFNTVLGDMADEVENIDVGGLSTTIGDLAIQLGSGDEEIRQVAASFFELGTSAGRSSEEVAGATEQILALAGRARALNPQLGEVADIASGLTTAFARGGRALAGYGIALSSAEINARALADTGKDSADQLTVFDKAAAGAAIATEKFGGSIKEAIGTAADDPSIRLASLATRFDEFLESVGTPIVMPILDLLDEFIPVAEDVAGSLGEVVEAGLPLVALFAKAAAVFTIVLKPIELAAIGLQNLEEIVGDLASAIPDLINAIPGVGVIKDVFGAIGRGFEALDDAIFGADEELRGFVVTMPKLSEEQQKAMRAAEAHTAEISRLDAALAGLASDSPALVTLLTDIRREGSPATAQLVDLVVAVEDAALSQEQLQGVAANLGVSLDDLTGFIETAGGAISGLADAATGSLPSASSAIDEVVEALGGIPEALDPQAVIEALERQITAIAAFQENLAFLATVGPNLAAEAAQAGPQITAALVAGIEQGGAEVGTALEGSLQALHDQTAATTAFIEDDFTPQLVEDLGVAAQAAGDAFGGVFDIAGPVAAEMDDTFELLETAMGGVATRLELGGAAATQAYGAAIDQLPIETREALDAADGVVDGFSAILGTKLTGAGADGAAGFGAGLAPVVPETTATIADLDAAIAQAFGPTASTAFGAGTEVGDAFNQGVAGELSQLGQIAAAAANAALASGLNAIRQQQGIRSPSTVWAERLGLPLVLGAAAGIEQGTAAMERAARDAVNAAGAVPLPSLTAAVGTRGAPTTSGLAGGGGSGGLSITLATGAVQVTVTGKLDGQEAQVVGRGIADGIVDQLARRDARLAARLQEGSAA